MRTEVELARYLVEQGRLTKEDETEFLLRVRSKRLRQQKEPAKVGGAAAVKEVAVVEEKEEVKEEVKEVEEEVEVEAVDATNTHIRFGDDADDVQQVSRMQVL